jgi:hypothetical protein
VLSTDVPLSGAAFAKKRFFGNGEGAQTPGMDRLYPARLRGAEDG